MGDRMPDWGEMLAGSFHGDRATAEFVACNLARHIEQMQSVPK